jgi:hypothetical protein
VGGGGAFSAAAASAGGSAAAALPPPNTPSRAKALDAETVSVSTTKELVEYLREQVFEREKEDDEKYNDLQLQLQSWRAERRLETEILLDALKQLSAAINS